MSSLKQIEANRRNALKSTGPATSEGKQRSRCDAIRHGLTAETVITTLEDADDYEAFQAAVIADYDTESAVVRELVLRLASLLWRLRRATGIESELFESTADDPLKHKYPTARETLLATADFSERNRLFAGAAHECDAVEAKELSFNPKKHIANCFLRLADLPAAPLDRLGRYEHTLWRQARQLLFTLESLRRRNRRPTWATFPFSYQW